MRAKVQLFAAGDSVTHRCAAGGTVGPAQTDLSNYVPPRGLHPATTGQASESGVGALTNMMHETKKAIVQYIRG